MRRIDLKSFVTLWTIVAMLMTMYGGAQAASLKEREHRAVHALFDLQSPTGSPFPSDTFTVPARGNNTKRRLNLPKPNCSARPSDCEDLGVINTLDGFNLQPRLSIPFDGPIDVTTVTSASIFLIRLGKTLNDEVRRDDESDRCDDDGDDNENQTERGDRVIGINQVVWDPLAKTLHVQSDSLLEQYTRYVLIVTNGLHDSTGHPVKAS